MELIKNIFFNTDKLIENTNVKISYTGKLFQNNSEKVYLHYGFGLNWDNLNEIEMTKTELGFQADIELLEGETLNLCYRNENNEWDNNDCKNYIFDLEKNTVDTVELAEDFEPVKKLNKLRKTYLWNKKVRLAIYKIIYFIPKMIARISIKKLPEN